MVVGEPPQSAQIRATIFSGLAGLEYVTLKEACALLLEGLNNSIRLYKGVRTLPGPKSANHLLETVKIVCHIDFLCACRLLLEQKNVPIRIRVVLILDI